MKFRVIERCGKFRVQRLWLWLWWRTETEEVGGFMESWSRPIEFDSLEDALSYAKREQARLDTDASQWRVVWPEVLRDA